MRLRWDSKYTPREKITVFLIRISDNPVSMWFAGRAAKSWENAGYNIEIVEAVKPETMDDQDYQLNFADTKERGKTKRPYTETEKAVFYSHIKALEIASRKASPCIIIEHDAECIQPWLNPEIYDEEIVPLAVNAEPPTVAYFIKAKAAKELVEHFKSIKIVGNLDHYVYHKMLEYRKADEMGLYRNIVMHNIDPSIGSTIEHPDYDLTERANRAKGQ